MKIILYVCLSGPFRNLLCGLTILITSCGASSVKQDSAELISDIGQQDSIFRSLVKMTSHLSSIKPEDSVSFLILPVQNCCPACRKKTIDSIVSHKNGLSSDQFIVLTANGGRKIIGSFFKEQGHTLPILEHNLYLDSTNQAYSSKLCDKEPTIYYAYNYKAYKKVASSPSTIKHDLHDFFSRNER